MTIGGTGMKCHSGQGAIGSKRIKGWDIKGDGDK